MKYLNDGGNYVKLYKNRNQLLIIILAVGFFVGILYENIISKSQGISPELFQSYFLKQFTQIEIVMEEYLWYVAKARVIPFLVLLLFGCLRWKKTIVSIYISWVGFLFGIIGVSSVLQLGIKGVLFCLTGLFPHMIFYVLAYGMYLLHLYRYPSSHWNSTKTVFVILMMILGIVLETYLSPIIVRSIDRIF